MKQIRIWQQSPAGWTPTFEIVPLEPPTYALVDDDDYDWLNEYRWFVILDGGKQRGRDENGQKRWEYPNPRCIITPVDNFIGAQGAHTERMSKMIIERHGGADTRFILPLDGNRLNNQRANLVCTNSNRMRRNVTESN